MQYCPNLRNLFIVFGKIWVKNHCSSFIIVNSKIMIQICSRILDFKIEYILILAFWKSKPKTSLLRCTRKKDRNVRGLTAATYIHTQCVDPIKHLWWQVAIEIKFHMLSSKWDKYQEKRNKPNGCKTTTIFSQDFEISLLL